MQVCPCDLPQQPCVTNCPPQANSKAAALLCTQLFSDNTRKILNRIKNTTSKNEKNNLRAFLNLNLLWPPEKKQLKVYFIITQTEFQYIPYGRDSIDPLDKKIKASGDVIILGNPPKPCLTKVNAVKYIMLILNERYNKFLGIYIILEVHQYFDNDNIYRNKIFAVKTYHFSDPKINENVI